VDRFFAYTRLLANGSPVGGATITVYNAGTLTLATIFDDNNPVPTPKSNPFLADTNGFFFFYAAPGRYDIRFEGGGPTPIPTAYTWGDIVFGESHSQRHVLATSATLGPDHTVSGLTVGHVLTAISPTDAAFQELPGGGGGVTDHGLLIGLSDDDHPQYALLVGRTGGQILRGSTAAAGILELDSTLSSTKGSVLLNKSGGNVGIGLSAPTEKLQVAGIIHTTLGGIKFPDGTIQITAAGGGGPGGQWITVGSDIYNANTGNVGIHTTAPIRRLHVLGGDTDTQLLRLEAVTGRPNVLEFVTGSTVHMNVSADPESCGLFNGTTSGSVRINQATGNVSIGSPLAAKSPNPPMPLYITAPPGQNDTIGLEAAAGQGATINFFSGSSNQFGSVGGGTGLMGMDCRLGSGTSITGNISLKPSNGYCGVGTFDPARKLHVISRDNSIAMRIETDPSQPGVAIELYDPVEGPQAFFGASKSAGFVNITNFSGTQGILINQATGHVAIVPDFAGFGFLGPVRPLMVESLASVPVQIRCQGRSGGGSGIEFYSGVQLKARLLGGINHTVWENQNGGGQSIAMQGSNGFVSIGNFAAIEKLDVTGNVHATGHTTSSDERFKDIIGGIGDVLPRLAKLRAVRYRWNEFYRKTLERGVGVDPEDVQIGLVAQEVLPHFPELVRPWYNGDQPERDDPRGQHYYSLLYEKFIPVLIEGIKELLLRVEDLEVVVGLERKEPE